MKIAALISRLLLGLAFTFFGLNGFLHFLPVPPLPPTPGGRFAAAMLESHFVYVVSVVQVLGGVLLLIGRYIPLALTLLGPIIVNIFFYHLLMDPKGLPGAVIVVILWFVLYARYRKYFSGLFI